MKRRKNVKRHLEYFDKKKNKWIRVPERKFTEEALKVYDFINAQMEIECLIEEMELSSTNIDKD